MEKNQLPIFFRYRYLWHILFWVVVFLMYWITYGGYLERYHQEFIINLALLPSRIIGTYVFIYLILPFVTEKKKFLTFGILAILHAFLYGVIIWISYYLTNFYTEYYDFSKYSLFYFPKIFNKLISNYGIPVLAAAIIIFKKWYIDEQRNKKLTKEKLAAELGFLKSQVHPHFLFNTLNNLYGLTLIKSDKTPDIVLKLSDLLDYMIYKSNDDFVPLEKEIKILECYIDLEKLRYDNRLDLKYEVRGTIAGQQIAPLIMLPFIENSFKHGASNDRIKPKVEIFIGVSDKKIQLRVFNTTLLDKKQDKTLSNGIGLKNVRRRLELIYPDNYLLEVKNETNYYEINLTIYLETVTLIKNK